MQHELTSGATVELRPIGEMKRRDKLTVASLQFEGIPFDNEGGIDWQVAALMPGGRGGINARFAENKRNVVIALVVISWSFEIPVPQVRDGQLVGAEGIGELSLDDYDELEELIDPYVEKLTRTPDPKAPAAATTSSSNGRSSAKAHSLKA